MDEPALPITPTLVDVLASPVDSVDDRGQLRGTDVEADRIAALLTGGMSVEDVLRDYPNLTRPQLAAALAYAAANPGAVAAYPTRTVKAALRAGRGGLAETFAAARGGE